MSATTIKLEGAILKELKEFKRSDQSLSALIRELLQSELRRRRMASAGQNLRLLHEGKRGGIHGNGSLDFGCTGYGSWELWVVENWPPFDLAIREYLTNKKAFNLECTVFRKTRMVSGGMPGGK